MTPRAAAAAGSASQEDADDDVAESAEGAASKGLPVNAPGATGALLRNRQRRCRPARHRRSSLSLQPPTDIPDTVHYRATTAASRLAGRLVNPGVNPDSGTRQGRRGAASRQRAVDSSGDAPAQPFRCQDAGQERRGTFGSLHWEAGAREFGAADVAPAEALARRPSCQTLRAAAVPDSPATRRRR